MTDSDPTTDTNEESAHHEQRSDVPGRGFDYNQITDTIFVGTDECCQVGYLQELLDQGIVAAISLEQERVDHPNGVDYFLWLPIEDHAAPTMQQLELGVQTLDFFVREGIKVFVHCLNGHQRSPTLVIAYLAAMQDMDVDEAYALVKEKRPTIHPNTAQIDAVRRFIATRNT